MEKHEWTFDEEFTCCNIYLKFAVHSNSVRYRDLNLTNLLLNSIALILDYIPVEEIEEKLRKIKQLNIDCGFMDRLAIEPLKGYGLSCKKALAKAVNEYFEYLDIIYPILQAAHRKEMREEKRLADENGIILLSSDDFFDTDP